MAETAKKILTSFLRRLTNLSGNNRGLLLLRLLAEQTIDIHSLSHLNGLKSFEIIRSLVKNSPFKLCAIHDSRFEATNAASQKLKMLQRMDHFVFEERGTNDLHVGWPFVRGKFSDGTLVRCPLIYFPVTLVQQGQYWVLEPRTDAGVTFNKAFILAYSFYQNIKVDEDLLDFSFEDLDKDVNVFRTQLYQLLDSRMELNFNTDNFLDELKSFEQFRRSDFDETHRTGELKMFPEAVLGLFPQTGSQLVPDYLQLLESDNYAELEGFFTRDGDESSIIKPGTYALNINGDVKEERLFTPFPLDAYQEKAIKMIKTGSSVVVQGPPGTGKSQLICNLLADAMAAGKKVLLVCQKRAALDVVYDRMQKKGLASFLALVHDYRNDRRRIFDKIGEQIAKVEDYKSKDRSVDIIQTERKFFQICRTIDQITEELHEFKQALYNESECGISPKQLYLSCTSEQPSINLKQEYHFFSFPLDAFQRKIKSYSQYANLFDYGDHPWTGRKSFAGLQSSDEFVIDAALTDIVSYQKEISTEIFRLTGHEMNLEDCESFWYRHEEVLGMLSLLKEDTTYSFLQHMFAEPEEETSLLWLSTEERVTMNCFDDIGPEVTIPTDKLGKFQEALHERMSIGSNLVRKIKWEFFSDNKFVVKRALVANDLAYNKYGLRVLEQRIDSRLNLEHHLTTLKEKPWLKDLPAGYNKEKLQAWFNEQKFAIRAKVIFHSLREVKDAINPRSIPRKEFHQLFRQMLDTVKRIPEKKAVWSDSLSSLHIRQVILNPSYAQVLRDSLKKDFDNLCEFDSLKANLHQVEQNVILKLHEHVNKWDSAELQILFDNSVRLAWLEHIELKYPILRSVSSMKMEELQRELLDLVNQKEKLSLDILLLRAREKSYEGLSYNRLNNLVTYRDLLHQVTKKKKLWPLRKLLSTFHSEIFQLVPCWMASPESVSAIFPMENLFDLVIFDEASQCFAEHGLPAIYRGKQILIAGDGQQLKPSELYRVRWTDDESETPDEEVESLLELAERYLPTVHLQGHYRSKSIELIAFSNRHFYESRLRLLPDREVMNREEPAIEYVKVDGVWENQVNPIEASVVVENVLNLIAGAPGKEIGIVTFNAMQQNLILDILEEETQKRNIAIPSSLFVKNIENVQGDEKDVIVFSIGYAPDKQGKMNMQFGSLNVAGGENRLNVAITRAREKIIIITSIWPEQLQTQTSKNPGPRLLQEYLAFARNLSEKKESLAPVMHTVIPGRHLSRELKSWGARRLKEFQFHENKLPYTDVNIMHDDKYLGVLLTDDERFEKSVSIKDAFVYTPALLERKNWKYKFVYSRQYWKDPVSLEQSLMLFIGKSDTSERVNDPR